MPIKYYRGLWLELGLVLLWADVQSPSLADVEEVQRAVDEVFLA